MNWKPLDIDIDTANANKRSLVNDQRRPDYFHCERCWMALDVNIKMKDGSLEWIASHRLTKHSLTGLFCGHCFERLSKRG